MEEGLRWSFPSRKVNTPCVARMDGSRKVEQLGKYRLGYIEGFSDVVIHTIVRAPNRRKEVVARFGVAEIEHHLTRIFVLFFLPKALRERP
jgi:hypothetical protein